MSDESKLQKQSQIIQASSYLFGAADVFSDIIG